LSRAPLEGQTRVSENCGAERSKVNQEINCYSEERSETKAAGSELQATMTCRDAVTKEHRCPLIAT